MQSSCQDEEQSRSRESAHEPIHTRGNAFWKGENRFLIKGIDYARRRPKQESEPFWKDLNFDVLSDEHLDSLRDDIKFLSELGLNTVQVRDLDPSKKHAAALQLLAQAGFYVLVKVRMHEAHPNETFVPRQGHVPDPEEDMQPCYTMEKVASTLRLVDELAEHPNILGFIVEGDGLNMAKATRLAELMRASVRDIKTFLRRRGGRLIPVGVSQPDAVMFRVPALQYFTAGDEPSRIDFWSLQCFSWAYKSSFQISGWKNMVQQLEKFPVPMFLGAYGPNVGKSRIWQEVRCLYSPDMTGVFSGGCAYTYLESGNDYGLVEIGEDGRARKKEGSEFDMFKREMGDVNMRTSEEMFGATTAGKDVEYETWVGEYPERHERLWHAFPDRLPSFPLEWEKLMEEIREENEWEIIEKPADASSVADALDRLNIEE